MTFSGNSSSGRFMLHFNFVLCDSFSFYLVITTTAAATATKATTTTTGKRKKQKHFLTWHTSTVTSVGIKETFFCVQLSLSLSLFLSLSQHLWQPRRFQKSTSSVIIVNNTSLNGRLYNVIESLANKKEVREKNFLYRHHETNNQNIFVQVPLTHQYQNGKIKFGKKIFSVKTFLRIDTFQKHENLMFIKVRIELNSHLHSSRS